MFWNRRRPSEVLRSLLLFALLLLPALFIADYVRWSILSIDVKWASPDLPIIYLWILGVSLLMVRFVDRRPVTSFGLGFHPWTLRELGLGGALGCGLAVAAILPTLLADGSMHWTGEWSYLWDDAFMILLLAAGEEILVRGYLLQRTSELVGDATAILLMSLLFLALHLGNINLTVLSGVNIFLAGLFFGALWGVTRSLWAPIGAHIGWNLTVGPIFDLPVSGITMDHSMLHLSPGLPEWVNGGSFGPEGGILCRLVLLGGIALVVTSRRIRIAPWTFSRTFRGELSRRTDEKNKPFSGSHV